MTKRQEELLNLLNEKYQLNEDEALTKRIHEIMDKLSEEALQYYINLMTSRLPQRNGSRKAKNARKNLIDSMERVANGYSTIREEDEEKSLFRLRDIKKNLVECFADYGAAKEIEIANKLFDNIEKKYLANQVAYEKIDDKEFSSLAVSLTDLKIPTGHETTYKNEKDTEKWMVAEYGEGNKAVVHIEGSNKYKKNGISYTEVSLFLNVNTKEPISKEVPINETNVKMKDNKGYKVRVAIPDLPKLTDASGFKFDKAMIHEILNNPESAKILSISEYNPNILRIKKTGKRYRCKGCTKELMFDSPEVEKLLDFKTLMSVNTDAAVKIKEVLDKAGADEKTKGHIKQYRESLRSKKLKETFTTVMSDNDAFKVSIGEILESALKGRGVWKNAEKTNWFGQNNKGTGAVEFFLANNCELFIEASEPNAREIKFSIDRVEKDEKTGAERKQKITGVWNIGRQYLPQEMDELRTSLAKDLMYHPNLLTLEKYEIFDKYGNKTFSQEIPDSSGIKKEIEKAIVEKTDSVGKNGYDCFNGWNEILAKVSTLPENSWNITVKKDKAIEVPFTRDSSASITINTEANKIEVEFKRPLNEKEIAMMPTYSPVSKNGKEGTVEKVVNGTMTLTGTLELPSEWKENQPVEKGKIVQFLTEAIKEGKVKPKETIIEAYTPKGKIRFPRSHENEVRPLEKTKETPKQDNEEKKEARKLFRKTMNGSKNTGRDDGR